MEKLTESTIIKAGIVIIFAIFAVLLINILIQILNHLLIPLIAIILAYLIIRWLIKKV